MSIVGTAHSPWLFWDGRKDSQWSQALGPLESAVEHGGHRTQYAQLVAAQYRADYEAVFGRIDGDASRVFANIGKAIAAYERKLEPAPSRFDAFAVALERGDATGMSDAMTRDEIAGLKLFIGKANCVRCHSGPLFTNDEFHNTGVPGAKGKAPDTGRADGVRQLVKDEFNCLGRYSDAKPEQCGELRFLEADKRQAGQFRVPSLRGVASRPPYMHAGQFATLDEVVAHYDRAPAAPQGRSELEPMHLDARERAQLVAFLRTLDSGVRADAKWLRAPAP
jgi:cytochrome c peroxidase